MSDLDFDYIDEPDVMTRFLKAAPEEMRKEAERIIKARVDLLHHMQCCLTETNPMLIAEHAGRVRDNVRQVTHEWAQLRRIVERWSHTEIRPMVVRLG